METPQARTFGPSSANCLKSSKIALDAPNSIDSKGKENTADKIEGEDFERQGKTSQTSATIPDEIRCPTSRRIRVNSSGVNKKQVSELQKRKASVNSQGYDVSTTSQAMTFISHTNMFSNIALQSKNTDPASFTMVCCSVFVLLNIQ